MILGIGIMAVLLCGGRVFAVENTPDDGTHGVRMAMLR